MKTRTRRRFLESVGLVLAGSLSNRFVAGGSDSAFPTTYDWPMARYDPAGTGYHPTASGPKDGVRIAWTHDTTDWFLGTVPPIRRGKTIYAVGNGLLALDSETGAKQFSHPGPYRSSPARVRSPIYDTATLAVATSSGVFGLNADGGLDVPLSDRSFGAQRWTASNSPRAGFFGPTSPVVPPVAADRAIYTPLPATDSIASLDPSDGTIQWQKTPYEDDSVSVEFNRPAVKDDLVFVTSWPQRVTAYRTDTGVKRWQRELDEQTLLPPVATEEGVVVPSRTSVRLLDAADGSDLWNRGLDGNAVESAPAVANGTIFVADEREFLYALDLATGKPLWTLPFDGPTSPVVADDLVYAVRSAVSLVGIDAKSGEKRFEYQPSQVPLSAPIVGDGVLYVTNRNRVIALEEAT